jgi:putative PIN family toxin of toxin-antitoxin system
VAAFAAHGACGELLEHCALQHEIVLSDHILRELREVLVRKFAFTPAEASAAEQLLRTRVSLAEPACLPGPVCRDPDDDAVLAAARGGNCSAIITGDKDLLALKRYLGIKILPPAAFWALESETDPCDGPGQGQPPVSPEIRSLRRLTGRSPPPRRPRGTGAA